MNPALPSPEELQKLSLYELIELLNDIQAPEPISFFPGTPFWAWIFWLATSIGLLLLFLFWKRWQRERYRKVACQLLKGITQIEGPAYAMQVTHILKWTALAAYPRRRVASLGGEDWLRFLECTCSGTKFTVGVGQTLASTPYQRNADFDEKALGALAERWILSHRRGVLS